MPYNYMDEYIDLLFKGDDESDSKKVRKSSIFFCNDSFYTVANLIHNPKDVALASILLGAKIMNVFYPGHKYYDMDKFKERVAAAGKNEVEQSKYWFKMLDKEIDLKKVNEIINSIYQFYDSVKNIK